MHIPKPIQKLFYWAIMISMVLPVSFPSGLIAAQTVGKIQKSPITLTKLQPLPVEPKLKTKQAETPLPFNFPDEQLVKNKLESGITFEIGENPTAISQEITSVRPLTKPFQLKAKSSIVEEPEVSTALTADREYFDSLVQKLNPKKPVSLTEAKSLSWSKISFEKPLSIKELVKQVPNELADEIIFPETEIVKGETSREKRTAPLIRLQSEYLIFFAKQGVNPIGQNLKINNRGEGANTNIQTSCS